MDSTGWGQKGEGQAGPAQVFPLLRSPASLVTALGQVLRQGPGCRGIPRPGAGSATPSPPKGTAGHVPFPSRHPSPRPRLPLGIANTGALQSGLPDGSPTKARRGRAGIHGGASPGPPTLTHVVLFRPGV